MDQWKLKNITMNEDVILTKVLEDKNNWQEAMDLGISSNHFQERRPLFSFIQDFYIQYGELPKEDIVKKNFPNWEKVKHENSFDYWVDELFSQKALLVQNEYIEKWINAKKAGKSPRDLAKIINKMDTILLTETSRSRDINLKNVDKEIEDYKERKEKEGMIGYPLGLKPFDDQSGGAQKRQLGVVMGPPKNMKTWLLLYQAYNTWVDGNIPLLISMEMTEIEMRDRLAFFENKFPFGTFSRGQLPKKQEEEYYANLKRRVQRADFHISADEGESGNGVGVSFIASKIERYQPTICFVDGAYLMSDDRGAISYEAVKNTFRDLKRLARRKDIPIIVSTQPQRLKEKDNSPLRRKLILEDVGNAYTISQDCDWMMGVRRISEDVIDVYIIGGRNIKTDEWQMRFDLENGIIQELNEEESLMEDELKYD